jgi:hypothetical protein
LAHGYPAGRFLLAQFASENANLLWSFDAQLDAVAGVLDHRNGDPSADMNPLARSSTQDQHDFAPPL